MPISKVGYLIKQRREELGFTQEELADGVCAVTTLSRIENGERLPTKNHYEKLYQRLGLSDLLYYTYVDEKTLELHEQKFRIRHLVSLRQYEEAKELLEAYVCSTDMNSTSEEQFVLLYSTIVAQNAFSPEERSSRFTEAISLSCPQFEKGVYPVLLSYEEIIILNNIAVCYWQMKNYDEAIHILTYLKQYYEKGIMNQEEILKTQTMILYNLSTSLGLAGRYDACIEICDLGIKISRETGRCSQLSKMLYNKAWSLNKRMLPGDMELAEKTAKEALFAAFAMDDKKLAEHFANFYKEHFPQSDLLIYLIKGAIT